MAEVKEMTRIKINQLNPNTGALYHNKIELADSEVSDIWKIPVKDLDSIGMNLIGDGTAYFTFSNPNNIEDFGDANWIAWDGSSDINQSVTAFYVESDSGNVTFEVTVRSEDD